MKIIPESFEAIFLKIFIKILGKYVEKIPGNINIEELKR